jgi:beta-mannosidase
MIYPFWTAETETLHVFVISGRWEEVRGLAQLTWYDWLGTPLSSSATEFAVPALNGSLLFGATGVGSNLPAGKNTTDVWLLLNLTAEVDNRMVTNEQYVSCCFGVFCFTACTDCSV